MSVELLKAYMEDKGISQNKLAVQLNVSPAMVSQYLNNKYKGDVKAMNKKVAELIERVKAKQADVASGFVMTSCAKRVLKNCKDVHDQCESGLIIARSGMGKTTAVKQYAQMKSGVLLIEVNPTYNTKAILMQLCKQLKMSDMMKRSNYEMMEAVLERLTGSDMLIIVDEAEYLSTKTLEVLRRIHDGACVGLILAGLPRLRANLRGRGQEFEQLFNRVGANCEIDSLPEADLEMMAEYMMGSDMWNATLVKASRGNARRLNKLCRAVVRVSQSNGRVVDDELIGLCADRLLVG